ncbi:GNAT family N-acetyltransferase [Pseudomarimonas arenosa]|uniref:GNAT family N-acetyltransferase n=1 Tax=Pseudomarimonas arenosa TaxID=2774145 RepID=A0AAW3ZJV7_9GAMM|nr:GNAT family N-acetyltransferase [Pseudomarimonas arenosa]MBD8526276.1 GNAT family N-acetyltransferase [Pseudomarimonas arenosa]
MQIRSQSVTRVSTLGGPQRTALRRDFEPSVAVTDTVNWRGHALLIRPIAPVDEIRHQAFFARLEANDLQSRFHSQLSCISTADRQRMLSPASATEVWLIALLLDATGLLEIVATANAVSTEDNIEAVCGIVVRSDLKHRGLGRLLLQRLVACARRRGTQRMVCSVSRENAAMRGLVTKTGFLLDRSEPCDGTIHYVKQLVPSAPASNPHG